MRLNTLYLKNFRNYQEEVISFSPSINYIYGDNAQGKTNLLEAISLLITGRSFRTRHLNDLIRFNTSAFYLEAHFEKNGVDQVLKMGYDGYVKTIIYNTTPLPALSSLLGILNGVILSPEDHCLIKGGPADRRHFLDMQLAKTNPLYLHHLSRYFQAMKQRNILLKKHSFSTIEVWEEQMALSATYLTLKRIHLINELNLSCIPLQLQMSQAQEQLKLNYSSCFLAFKSNEDSKQYFLNEFARLRLKESKLGNTLTGPHRDDLQILINEKPARSFASEGQQRSCAAALRMAEWERLKSLASELPFMCIDDVGISLDIQREKILLELLKAGGQVFLTSPREETALRAQTAMIHIEGGKRV